MNKYQKYVNALFLAAAALIWFISRHYVGVAIGYFQLGRKIGGGADVIQHALPLVLGALTFWLLRSNQASQHFTTDSVAELSKVTWPNDREVRVGTVVVIITVLAAGLILGVIDLGFTALVRTIIGA